MWPAKTRRCVGWLMIALLAAPASVGAAPLPFATLDLYANAGPVSIDAAMDEWRGVLRRGDFQETDNLVEFGLASDHWRASFFYRHAQSLRFSPDTGFLYHQVTNGQTLPAGASYALALRAERFSALGLRVRRGFPVSPHLVAGVTFSAFRAGDLLAGGISGNATVLDSDSFSYDAVVAYRYDEDVLFDRPAVPPAGYGAALGVDAQWHPSARLGVSLAIDDLLGAIAWQDVPMTVASASSGRTWIDSAGKPVVGPLVSGRESWDAHWTQRVPATGRARVSWLLHDGISVEARMERHLVSTDWSVAAVRQRGPWTLGLSWFPELGGVGFVLAHRQVAVELSGDHAGLDVASWQRLQVRAGPRCCDTLSPP